MLFYVHFIHFYFLGNRTNRISLFHNTGEFTLLLYHCPQFDYGSVKIHTERDEHVEWKRWNECQLQRYISHLSPNVSQAFLPPDKATELSNCFLLLLPWWQEGTEEVNQRLISLGNRCHCFSHALLLCAEIVHIHKWFLKCFKGKRKKVKVWIVMCTLLKHLQLLCLAACRVQRFLLNAKS